MLNNKKIRTMTKLAIYEQNRGKEDIAMAKFYKSDYVRYNLLKTCVAVTTGYLLVLLMIGVYEAVAMDWKAIGIKALAVYILIMTAYIIGSIIGFNVKYEKSRGRLARYYKRLRYLDKQYNYRNSQEG